MLRSRWLAAYFDGAVKGLGFATIFTVFIVSALFAQSLQVFSAGDLISAAAINANFTRLENRLVPIGSIQAWHRDLNGAIPALPDGWVECNGQTLSDSESVLDGQIIPDLNNARNGWNSAGSFLRGGTASGTFESDQFQGHSHTDPGHTHGYTFQTPEWVGYNSGYSLAGGDPAINQLGKVTASSTTSSATTGIGDPTATGYNAPRYGFETKPVNMSVVWIMRVK